MITERCVQSTLLPSLTYTLVLEQRDFGKGSYILPMDATGMFTSVSDDECYVLLVTCVGAVGVSEADER